MFNLDRFNKIFDDVVQKFFDSFDALVLKEVDRVDPATGYPLAPAVVASPQIRCSWKAPLERTIYRISGRIFETDVKFFIPVGTDISQGDTIFRMDNKNFYDVLGIRAYDSHLEVDASFSEVGPNFNVNGAPAVFQKFVTHDVAPIEIP